MRPERVRSEKRLENARFESVRLENVRARLGNVKARLGNVKEKLSNVRAQRSFLEADKARHLQLHLLGPDNNTTEHQQLRQSWLEDKQFGKYIERKCIKRERALDRPGEAREHSGKIKLEGSNSED